MVFSTHLTKELSIFIWKCSDLNTFASPFFSFGPWIIDGGLISSLKWKAFTIEYTENLNISYLLLDETVNDQELYWQNLYKFDDLNSTDSNYWHTYVKSQFIDDF